MLKLSGEALVGDGSYGISPEMIKSLALDLKTVFELDVQLCIVIGGGIYTVDFLEQQGVWIELQVIIWEWRLL